MRSRARDAILVAVIAALAIPAGAASGILDPEPRTTMATSGNHSELIKKLPISRKHGRRERVAMSLGPGRLEPIEAGDTIRVGGEVQFSTTCVTKGEARCIGRPYQYSPRLSARIVLAPERKASAPSMPLSAETVTRNCKQRRPNRNHHCTLVLPNVDTAIPNPAGLPCAADACYVNLIVGASHRKARRNNVVVLGADRPDASVVQDKGRLNAVQMRGDAPAPVRSESGGIVNDALPLTEGKKVKRRVIHSVPIEAPTKGEVLAFDSSFIANINHLRFNAFVSARAIVGEKPTSTDSAGFAKAATAKRGDATEANGFNCTLGRSGYSNPCTVAKSGATKFKHDAVDGNGLPATVYLNIVGSAKPLLPGNKLKGAPRIAIGPADGLTVLRYTP